MALWETVSGSFKDLFVGPKAREQARQVSFHLKQAEMHREEAFAARDEVGWNPYVEDLARALVADPESFEAHWMRCLVMLHRFRNFPPSAREAEGLRLASTWNEDLKWLLTHFPDPPPPGTSLAQARQMREEFDRLCRGYKIG
jgi:hypothetical protein